MLLHQGAAAFTLWTGKPAPLELMQRKLEEARAGGVRSAEGEPTGEPEPKAEEQPTGAGAAEPKGEEQPTGGPEPKVEEQPTGAGAAD
jgi:shikimate dehydrogenase